MNKRAGDQTLLFDAPVYFSGHAALAGQNEKKGPFGSYYDYVVEDALYGEKSFEKAEKKMFQETVKRALADAGKREDEIDFFIGGDLLNQIISAGYTARDMNIPFLGIYGACSTMAQGLCIGGMLIDGGFAENVICATSSHFATAERQFRYPLELGTPKTPTSQNTATATGTTILSKVAPKTRPLIALTSATVGNCVDYGITDANNMGAAMAPAAAETIVSHLRDTGRQPSYYDLIVTGDLGTLGSQILLDFTKRLGYDLYGTHMDCGVRIYEGQKDICCGGSGCGCGASTLNGYLLKEMEKGALSKVLFVATGALLSTTSVQQGESIPSIAHAAAIERIVP